MRLVSTRADGRLHRLWTGVMTTPEPWCFYIPPSQSVFEPDGREWSSPYPVIGMFWPDRWYQLFMLLQEDQTSYYCNIIRPPAYDEIGQTVTFVDLDLDLFVDCSGVRVLDEDEFEARKGSYPRGSAEAAEAAVKELRGLAVDAMGPFAPATERRWRVWVHARQT